MSKLPIVLYRGPSLGAAPTLAVTLNPEHGWSIYT